MTKKNIFDLFFALFIFSLVVSGCFTRQRITGSGEQTAQPVETFTTPRLRVQNIGINDIKNLTVLFPDSQIHFGDIPAGATTEYQPAPKGVYNYAAYRFEMNGQESTQPVVDWVGESPRPAMSFTYIIDFNPARPAMQAIRLISVQNQ